MLLTTPAEAMRAPAILHLSKHGSPQHRIADGSIIPLRAQLAFHSLSPCYRLGRSAPLRWRIVHAMRSRAAGIDLNLSFCRRIKAHLPVLMKSIAMEPVAEYIDSCA